MNDNNNTTFQDGYYGDSYEPKQYNQTHLQPGPNPAPSDSDKLRAKKIFAPRLIAAMTAIGLAAGAAGGGVTFWMLERNSPPAIASPHSITAIQEAPLNTTPLVASGSNTISAIVKKAAVSVVEITTGIVNENRYVGRYVTEGAGSGVIISEDGYIVTNNHVVNGASNITVRTNDGTEHEATLVGIDARTDLAVIKIDANGLTPATFADSATTEVGELAVAIGNPLGTLGGTVTNGIISAKDREITIGGETMKLLQTSAAVNPGNSGGGLFDAAGNLVGVVNAKSAGSDIEGLGFAIPSNTVKEVVSELILHGYVSGRPQLGIGVIEVLDPMTAAMYRLGGMGIYVGSVLDENNSLKKGDRISSINGKEIQTTSDITAILSEHKVGDVVTVKVFRDGKEAEVSVTLTEQIPEAVKEPPKSAAEL